MQIKKLIAITLLLVLAASCKKKETKTDNIFRFRDYISYTTSGRVSVVNSIQINLANAVDGWEIDQEITENIITIKPHVSGKLIAKNKQQLAFIPDENLEPNTEYTVTVRLGEIYKNLPSEYKNYTFQFKTITPNFNIVTNNLQSYNKEWQYLEAVLKSADVITLEKAKQLVEASQKGKPLNIEWNESEKVSNLK